MCITFGVVMDKIRKTLGVFSFYLWALVGALVANRATQLHAHFDVGLLPSWAIPLGVAVIGWVIAGIHWKMVVTLGLPRFYFRWPRWLILHPSFVIVITMVSYIGMLFLPGISIGSLFLWLAVMPLVPASSVAFHRLMRENDDVI
tara:strand:- start:29 stop:463 length:435 start_codon:yes stop_codon:yes gene_type:complete